MKKSVVIIFSLLLVLILGVSSYSFIWGGKPRITNFDEISKDYESIAKTALDYYKKLSTTDEFIILNISENELQHENQPIPLTNTHPDTNKHLCENFDYLRVYINAVFFCEDETGYYGLVYAYNPLFALYQENLPQQNREYHRINSHWYEWGVFGR